MKKALLFSENSSQLNLTRIACSAMVLFGGLLLFAAPVSGSLADGLVAYYPFTGNAQDASGNGNHGIVNGAGFTNSGPHGTALQCSGSPTSHVVVPASASLQPTNAISVSLWCKGVPSPGFNAGTILRKADNCSPGYFIRMGGVRPNNTPEFMIDPQAGCVTAHIGRFVPSTGAEWLHLVATYSMSDGSIKTFVNGTQVAQTPLSIQLQHSGNLFIGAATVSPFDGGFHGLIDEVRIYNRALSEGEVRALAEIDLDGDGVPDGRDACPNTPAGAVVDENGCSVGQIVPCAGPRTGSLWQNHGQYVSTIAAVAEVFVQAGLISPEQAEAIVSEAARSECGKR